MAFELRSTAIENDKEIPIRFTAQGLNVSPPLEWYGVPEGSAEFALLCEDPDAPTPRSLVHWIAYGIPASATTLPESIATKTEVDTPFPFRQGINSYFKPGYTGPNPPFWHHQHHYHFRLFALDTPLMLPRGIGRNEFLDAIQGHVLGEARLTGLYEKPDWAKRKSLLRLLFGAGVAAVSLGVLLVPRRISEEQKKKAA